MYDIYIYGNSDGGRNGDGMFRAQVLCLLRQLLLQSLDLAISVSDYSMSIHHGYPISWSDWLGRLGARSKPMIYFTISYLITNI